MQLLLANMFVLCGAVARVFVTYDATPFHRNWADCEATRGTSAASDKL